MNYKLKNMLRLFLDSIRDYEHENGNRICEDERPSEEFVDLFINSEDAFDYHDIKKEFTEAIALLEQAQPIWKDDTKRWEDWHNHTDKLCKK